jgi:hypothetical protein
MGKKRTESAFKQLSKELPPVKKMERDEYWVNKDVGMKVFVDDKDREQFICRNFPKSLHETKRNVLILL